MDESFAVIASDSEATQTKPPPQSRGDREAFVGPSLGCFALLAMTDGAFIHLRPLMWPRRSYWRDAAPLAAALEKPEWGALACNIDTARKATSA